MSTTPAKGRTSGIPTPGRTSHIPTPGRPRSSSSVHHPASVPDDDFASRAFAEAIRANDPASHRFSQHNTNSLSPPTHHAPLSGRSSAAGRPSSVASSASAVSSTARSMSGSKQPQPRPTSRASDAFARSSSRAGRTFEVGDNVRIESLGFEGTLRFLGEIEGKAGLFAGVELSGGFAGKGKNDGSVSGKRYFACAPNCGVFIAASKLSPPTVGAGSISRPSSVASSRNGRATPSLSASTSASGRRTPSGSNGRATPGLPSGRVTPSASSGRRTPGGGPATRTRTTTITSRNMVPPVKKTGVESMITPGSRASKYVGLTAKQLSSRVSGASSPSRSTVSSPTATKRIASPIQSTFGLASSTRTTGSPYTPKAGRVGGSMGPPTGTPTRARTMNTPRARLSSTTSMPPPPSPSSSSRRSPSVSLNDPIRSAALVDLTANQRAIQEMIEKVARPASSASVLSNGTEMQLQQLQLLNDKLQARLDALEDENKRLSASLTAAEASASSLDSHLNTIKQEREQSSSRITELESSLRASERALNEKESQLESLQRHLEQSAGDIEKAKSDGEARIRDLQSKLDDKEALVFQLKELIDAKEGQQSENDAVLAAKNAEIAVLEARVQKAYAELEEERRELGGQVDELRKAGQETIALYEERLSAADSRRYEMEDIIASLQEQLQAQARPVSPSTMARQATTALEIDNESLREQVQHLQKKLGTLEDLLEDARMIAEREENSGRERLMQYKEREDALRQELLDGQKEYERVIKSEESARARVVEIEEALRENTVALENARAEIEGLRADIADLEGIAAAAGVMKSPQRVVRPLTGEYELLKAEKEELGRTCKEREAELTCEREKTATLHIQLEERNAELDAIRKKLNREQSLNGADEVKKSPATSSPSKQDLHAAKEEIKGLKHIIQELQLENAKAAQRNKVLESENKLLLSEVDQLREDMKALEENVEQTLLREEQALEAEEAALNGSPDDVEKLQKTIREMRGKYEAELEQMRKRLSEAEMKSARAIHDLNKEIGELESLIESKIYREDELEREVARLQERLAKSQKKSSKGLPEDPRSSTTPSLSSVSSSMSSRSESVMSDSASRSGGEDVCEICEKPGHDIFSCDLLKEDRPLSVGSAADFLKKSAADDLFCEDCEEHGHTAINCPHSLDVF